MEKINKKTILYTIGVAALLVIAYYSRAFHAFYLRDEFLKKSSMIKIPHISFFRTFKSYKSLRL